MAGRWRRCRSLKSDDAASQGADPHCCCSIMLQAHEVGEQATQKAHQAAAYTREKVEKLGEYGRAKAGEVAEEVNTTSHAWIFMQSRSTQTERRQHRHWAIFACTADTLQNIRKKSILLH